VLVKTYSSSTNKFKNKNNKIQTISNDSLCLGILNYNEDLKSDNQQNMKVVMKECSAESDDQNWIVTTTFPNLL